MASLDGRQCLVGMAAHKELDCPGFETRWGRDLPDTSRLAFRPTHSSLQWIAFLIPSAKSAKA